MLWPNTDQQWPCHHFSLFIVFVKLTCHPWLVITRNSQPSSKRGRWARKWGWNTSLKNISAFVFSISILLYPYNADKTIAICFQNAIRTTKCINSGHGSFYYIISRNLKMRICLISWWWWCCWDVSRLPNLIVPLWILNNMKYSPIYTSNELEVITHKRLGW